MDYVVIELIRLLLVFSVIIAVLYLKNSMYVALLAATLAATLVWRIPLTEAAVLLWKGASAWDTVSLILILYVITFLQRLLEDRQQLKLAQQDLYGLFNSRRVNAAFAPVLIGLLPSAAAVTICGEIVDEASGDKLSVEEKTFVTSYFRHIPESFVPTYTTILIMSNISGVRISDFVLLSLPLVAALYLIGYFYYIRRIPKETGLPNSINRLADLVSLLKHLWTLLLIIVLILAFQIPVLTASLLVTALAWFFYRFRWHQILHYLKRAVEWNIILNMLLIMIFKEFLAYTGVITVLPEFFERFPLSQTLIFGLIFFFGALISGSQAIATICTAAAFAAVPGGGTALMVMLHSFAYAAMQISPVHVCSAVIIEFFHTSFGSLVRKGLPVILSFCVVSYLYYLFLTSLLGMS